jgi:hypothetical protein
VQLNPQGTRLTHRHMGFAVQRKMHEVRSSERLMEEEPR